MRIREDVQWREADGEIIALDLNGSRYLTVNGSGSTLWPLLVTGTDEPALARALVDAYGIDEDRALADVRAFLEWLRREALLETT